MHYIEYLAEYEQRAMSTIPLKLLSEAQGQVVTVELVSGETYRGRLVESEECMNVEMRDVIFTGSDSHQTRVDRVFLRGSQVRFVVVPEILKHAPLFKLTPRPPPPIRGRR